MKTQQSFPETIGSLIVSVLHPVPGKTDTTLNLTLKDILEYAGTKETLHTLTGESEYYVLEKTGNLESTDNIADKSAMTILKQILLAQ